MASLFTQVRGMGVLGSSRDRNPTEFLLRVLLAWSAVERVSPSGKRVGKENDF
jgi:hypothetical protein